MPNIVRSPLQTHSGTNNRTKDGWCEQKGNTCPDECFPLEGAAAFDFFFPPPKEEQLVIFAAGAVDLLDTAAQADSLCTD